MVEIDDIKALLETHEKMKHLPFVAAGPGTSLIPQSRFHCPAIPKLCKFIAIRLKNIVGLDKMDDSLFKDKYVRQVEYGQFDENNNDIGGKFVVSDVVAVCLVESKQNACNWVKRNCNVNKEIADSLTYIASWNSSVSLLIVD